MSRITKFKVIPQTIVDGQSQGPLRSEEVEFVVTRYTKMTTTTSMTTEVDEDGNVISPHYPLPVQPPTNEIDEYMEAISLPSREPATVIVLETTDGQTEAGRDKDQFDNEVKKPINISELMRQDVRKVNPNNLF